MTFTVKTKNHRQKVLFKRRGRPVTGSDHSDHSDPSPSSTASTENQSLDPDRETRIPGFLTSQTVRETLAPDYSTSRSFSEMSAKTARASMIPDIFTSLPPIRDLLNTQTSQIQEETIQECLHFLTGIKQGLVCNDNGVPNLDRKRHIQFLHKSLKQLPAPYVAADASRPWMFYWALAGLATMGEDISEYRQRLVDTVRPIQNTTGGFGGGNGQMSHLAPTYAIALALAMVGGSEALEVIDRKAMWKWLGALKQPDGGFQMAVGGEEDIR
jgi:protein farnesyltransferase subunit beta